MIGKIMNWKTTLSGIASIASGIVGILNGHIQEGSTAIAIGLGLLFAKDHNN